MPASALQKVNTSLPQCLRPERRHAADAGSRLGMPYRLVTGRVRSLFISCWGAKTPRQWDECTAQVSEGTDVSTS
jgi:hypothetical protein